MKRIIIALAALLAPATARATPQPLPFSYVYETLPKGNLEVEQYVDYTPVKVTDTGGHTVNYGASQFQTEFEYGVTYCLELGLYATIAPVSPGAFSNANEVQLGEGTGLKERLRYRFAEEGQLPVDLGVYLELVENQTELEVEMKLLLQRRIGDLRLVANLWAEREYEGLDFKTGDWVFNPTVGATYQVTPVFHPGVESWMRAEYPDAGGVRTFNLGPQVYVGPTVMFDFGNFWFSAGGYWRVTDTGHQLDATVPDFWGNFWLRMVIGLSFDGPGSPPDAPPPSLAPPSMGPVAPMAAPPPAGPPPAAPPPG